MPEPIFGVVLLNWNGIHDTTAALDSLLAATPRPRYVIVVDNGSADDSLDRLEHWAREAGITWGRVDANAPHSGSQTPWLLIIASQTNRGFAAGNNLALHYFAHQTNATHFLLLNNDAIVAPDYFEKLRGALVQRPDVGLLGSAIYYEPERDKVWYAGGREIPFRALVLHRYDMPSDDRLRETTFVTGCAMLIARPLYDQLGGLAECYTPIYWEDTDYSWRAVAAGVSVMWAPGAKVYHKVGSSVGGERITPQVAFWQNRHRGYYVRRNYTGLNRWMALAYLFATKPGRSAVELLRGHPAMGSAIVRGFAAGVFGKIPA